MLRPVSSTALAILVLAAGACSSRDEEPRATSSAIVGGTASGADDDAVVLLLSHDKSKDTAQGPYYENCTGTLVAPNLVLTARHCIEATSSGTFTCSEDGGIGSGSGGVMEADFVPSETLVFTGSKLPADLSPDKATAHGASYVHDDGSITCNHDVALVVLDRDISSAKVASIRLDGDVAKGEGLTVVGWGATETTFLPSQRQRRTGVTVVDSGPSSTFRIGGTLAASEFIATESVCTGDSGGPAFSATTGAIVGVVSRGDNGGVTSDGSGCVGTQHTFMKTSAFASLLQQAFTRAGATPLREGSSSAPDAGDDAAPDAGAPRPTTTTTTTGGCGLASGPSPGVGSLLLVAIVSAGAAVRRRRRRPR